ncbi:MAG TPA: DNA-binding response regulator [Microscillaceae bacterium]|nr:DNA-binding response regulator [Microscillaceae bacterium]
MPVTIAIADDQQLFRKGLRSLLEDFQGIKVILEAENGEDLVHQLASKRPDLILLDLKMPKMNGLETLQYLKEHEPEVKVLMLTMHGHEKYILRTLELGANGFLMKDCGPEELLQAIEDVMQKGNYYNDNTLQVMRNGLIRRKREKPRFNMEEKLSGRELEVLQFSCQGLTADEIGERLFITKRTVEGHRRNILEKTKCKNLVEMVVYALQNNLVTLE